MSEGFFPRALVRVVGSGLRLRAWRAWAARGMYLSDWQYNVQYLALHS